jgi:hypothetical protein
LATSRFVLLSVGDFLLHFRPTLHDLVAHRFCLRLVGLDVHRLALRGLRKAVKGNAGDIGLTLKRAGQDRESTALLQLFEERLLIILLDKRGDTTQHQAINKG